MTPIWRHPGDHGDEREGVLAICSLTELAERPDVRDAIAHARKPQSASDRETEA